MKEYVRANSMTVTDIDFSSCQYPNVAASENGRVFLNWQEYKDGQDTIFFGEISDKKLINQTKISGRGQGLMPKIHMHKDVLWNVWSEFLDDKWHIFARTYKDNVFSELIEIQKGEANFFPSICDDGEKVVILWSEQTAGVSKTVAKYVDGDSSSIKEEISIAPKAYRPTGCFDANGIFYVVYEVFNGEHYDIVLRMKMDGEWSQEKIISNNEEWATRPIIKKTKTGASVFWYDFGREARFSYQYCDLKMEDKVLIVGQPGTICKGVNWYQDISMESNSDGVCAIAYTSGKTSIHVRYRKPNEAWSKPVEMSYSDGTGSVHPNIFIDGNDTVHLAWQFANVNGHKDRNASVVYTALTLDEIDQYSDESIDQVEDSFTRPIKVEKAFDANDEKTVEEWLKENGYEGLKVAFGDIHGQSGISDGVGQIDQFYHFAKVGANLDFTALTDHDCYPDWLSQSEWEWIRTTCRLLNEEAFIVALLAYEWTPNEYKHDFGHKNVYYRDDIGEVFRSCDIGGLTPFNLFASVKKYKGMAFPHHPAAVWSMVSAATDWNFHDDEVQRMVEIFSRHAPFEYYGNKSIYTKNNPQTEKHSVQDALARGYRLGIGAGSDSHQMEHGIEGGIIGVFVPNVTREDVFDALYKRFNYGTTGARILVSFKINNQVMGTEIKLNKGDAIEASINILGTDSLKVELIKDNKVVVTEDSQTNKCVFTFEDIKDDESHFYYVRVTQCDEHQAWSSPIWID